MPTARWREILQASKEEALLSVDLYNSPSQARSLEGFFIHMHIAWLYLLHAEFRRAGINYHYRQPNGRYIREDGERKTWDLKKCFMERWQDNDPVRKNLEFTRLLRNKIEHRYERAFRVASAGYAQALLVNYEDELTSGFGISQSLASELRFPVFLGTLTESGLQELRHVKRALPRHATDLLTEFRSALDPRIADDQRFEFRVTLIPMLGPKSQADVALRFIREDELTDSQKEQLVSIQRGTVIVRERERVISNFGMMKPKEVARKVESAIPFRFRTAHVSRAWQVLGVRPSLPCDHPERTDERYCVYDPVHEDYVYSRAFVEKLINEVGTRRGFINLLGWNPRSKPSLHLQAALGESA